MPTFQIPALSKGTSIGRVSAGDVWSFGAEGRWVDWWIPCGPDGYRNFLADILDVEPRVADYPWFCLMGTVQDKDGDTLETFPIGRGCTHAFGMSGDVIVFANDKLNMYGNNKGAISLEAVPYAAPPCSTSDDPTLYQGLLGSWRLFRRTLDRTQGALFVLSLVLVPSLILIFLSQGQDLVRSLGEGRLWVRKTVFAISLLFLGLQAWFWTRMIVTSNYGTDRSKWFPRPLLEWGPRVIGIVPFLGVAISLFRTPEVDHYLVSGLVVLGAVFFAFLVWRQDLAAQFAPSLGARNYAVLGLALAAATMGLASWDPVRFAWSLGPPAVVFLGLGLIIPPVVVAIQFGTAFRIPVTLLLLIWAGVISTWMDNHAVGRRAFVPELHSADLSKRTDLDHAYEQWKKAQGMVGSNRLTMVLVAAEGGASRAGYWTANVLSALHDKTRGSFAKHMFAINSVSGGSVGAVGYVAMLHSGDGVDSTTLRNRLLGFAGEDALSPTLAGMLYTDLLQRFLPVPFLPDRAEGLERAWERAWASNCAKEDKQCHALLSGPFLDLGPTGDGAWRPIPIVQGAGEESGRRILTSRLELKPTELDADDFYEITGSDVAVSTAIHNGARFPWVSPAGTLLKDGESQGHILDGGYCDNAGAETIRELVRAIENGPAKAAHDQIHFIVVVIAYREATKNAEPASAAVTGPPGNEAQALGRTSAAYYFMNEVLAPFVGLFQSRQGHGAHLRQELKLAADGSWGDADPFAQSSSHRASSSQAEEGQYSVKYIPVVLCDGQVGGQRFAPTTDWALSAQTKTFIANATEPGSAGSCAGIPGVETPPEAIKSLADMLTSADAAHPQ